MLIRLVKYDIKAISRIAVPMIIASWMLSFLCCAVLYFTFGFAERLDSIMSAFIITGSPYLIGVVAIGIMMFLINVVIALRYYRSVFGDEGYLNMSIPVSRRAFLHSKIISSAIWSVLASVTASLCVFVSVVLPMILYDVSMLSDVVDIVKVMFGISDRSTAFELTALALRIAVSVLNIVKDVAVIIASITLGSMLFKKLKLPSSLIIYFAINFFASLFTDAVKITARALLVDDPVLTLALDFVFEFLIISVITAAMYYTSLYFLKKRLNLE